MAQTISPEIAVEQAVDDLTKVVGIGPAVEKHLHRVGIVHYSQLASMKPKKIASLVKDIKGITEKRIVTEDWLGQAQRLAAEAGMLHTVGEALEVESGENSKHRQHYAVFTCELLLDRLNQVRRTRVMHVQSQKEVAWAGWVPGKLEGFLAESAQLSIAGSSLGVGTVAQACDPNAVAGLTPDSEEQKHPKAPRVLYGAPKILDFQLRDLKGKKLGVMIPSGQPFTIQLDLDLRQVSIETGEQLRFAAELFVKNLEGTEPLGVSKNEGLLTLDEMSHEIEVQGQPLAPGDYNLDALVMLWPQSQTHSLRNQFGALVEGMLIHCYEGGS